MRTLLLYYTKTGHTLEAAEAIAKGVTASGNEVKLVAAKDFNPAEVKTYDMLIVGSPCWGGSMGAGIASPVTKALKMLGAEVEGKTCAGFSVYGGSGGKNTVASIGSVLKKKGCSLYIDGPAVKAGAPLSLWKGPAITAQALADCQTFGMELAKRAAG
jgi:flavodoxin